MSTRLDIRSGIHEPATTWVLHTHLPALAPYTLHRISLQASHGFSSKPLPFVLPGNDTGTGFCSFRPRIVFLGSTEMKTDLKRI